MAIPELIYSGTRGGSLLDSVEQNIKNAVYRPSFVNQSPFFSQPALAETPKSTGNPIRIKVNKEDKKLDIPIDETKQTNLLVATPVVQSKTPKSNHQLPRPTLQIIPSTVVPQRPAPVFNAGPSR